MMKNLTTIGLVCFLFCMTTKVYSQGNASIHFGPSFPVLDFASDNFLTAGTGAAAIGLNVGVKYTFPLSENGWGIFGGIDFNYNGLQKDYKDAIEELSAASGYINSDYKWYKYINVPLTAGLNYSKNKNGFFANAGLALNFLKKTKMEVNDGIETRTQKVGLTSSIGFKIGGGIFINRNTSISIDYYGLGKHDLDIEIKSPDFTDHLDAALKVDLFTLTLGFRL